MKPVETWAEQFVAITKERFEFPMGRVVTLAGRFIYRSDTDEDLVGRLKTIIEKHTDAGETGSTIKLSILEAISDGTLIAAMLARPTAQEMFENLFDQSPFLQNQ